MPARPPLPFANLPRGRTCSGHPRLETTPPEEKKTWMPGTSPGKRILLVAPESQTGTGPAKRRGCAEPANRL